MDAGVYGVMLSHGLIQQRVWNLDQERAGNIDQRGIDSLFRIQRRKKRTIDRKLGDMTRGRRFARARRQSGLVIDNQNPVAIKRNPVNAA